MKSNIVYILEIDIGDNCDAWYYCSDGKTYYDSMFTFDVNVGDEIEPSDYTEC